MSYGIQIYGSNGSNLQLDSDLKMSYLQVLSVGTGTSVSVTNANALVFIQPTAASSSTLYSAIISPGGPFNNAVGSGTYNFVNVYGTAVTVNYVVVAPVYTTSVTPSGYGVAVYNSLGNLAFTSNAFVSGGASGYRFDTISVKTASDNISGNFNLSSSIVYSGTDYLSVYSLVTGAVWGVYDFGGNGDYQQGYLYNNNQIKYASFVQTGGPPISPNLPTVASAYTLSYTLLGKLSA